MSGSRLPDWAREAISYRVPATNLSLALSYIAGVYGIWQGMTIILTDPVRFQNPVYQVMDHHHVYWGMAVAGLGAAVLFGLLRRRWLWKAAGLVGLSAWHAVFAVYSLKAEIDIPTAASTPTPVYAFVAVALATLVWMDEKRLTYAINASTKAR